MNFLAPLFLLGGLAIAAPVLYHLIRRTTRERTVFSSIMFLLPSPPRISKRHRLENLLLLLLRCAAVALLALGFARPFLIETPAADTADADSRRVAVLLDVSASMRRTGMWEAAVVRAEAAVRGAGPADALALFAFARETTPILSFEEWSRTAPGDRATLAAGRLAAMSPGWGGTHLGNALITAAEALAEAESDPARRTSRGGGPREIVVISDLQEGSRVEALQAYEWPRGIALRLESIKAAHPTNAGVHWVADSEDSVRAADVPVRVRVTNAAGSKREQFKLDWSASDGPREWRGTPVDAYVPPGRSRVIAVPLPGNRAEPGRITLEGDDEAFDNAVHVIPPRRRTAGILWIGAGVEGGDARHPLFFLRRAFSDTPLLSVNIDSKAGNAPLTGADLKAADLIFVSDSVSADAAGLLRGMAEAGKTVVAVPRDAGASASLGSLLGVEGLRMQDVQPATYAILAEIDFRHPLFAVFADARFSDFTRIHFWKYRKLDPAAIPTARTVAAFDNGDPAVLEVPAGAGRIILLLTGWQPEDSQLAVSSKFVPLVWSLLELGGGVPPVPAQFIVGDRVPAPRDAAVTSVRAPDGTLTPFGDGAAAFGRTLQPGIHEFMGDRPYRFAVNLDPAESRTEPMDTDALRSLGVPLAGPEAGAPRAAEGMAALQGVEAEGRQKLWRWFVAATLAVLVIETALAGWTARRTGAPVGEGAS